MNNTVVQLNDANINQGKHLVLESVNMNLVRGEFTYLIGKTGAGKSSLLKTLYGALPLQKGQGRVAEYDLRALNRKNIPLLRRKLGMVFQDFNLLPDRSVAENLLFVLRATGWKNQRAMDDRIRLLLEQVDLKGQEKRMPHTLSGGEQQRVVMARALLNDPIIILADEPTGNLDPDTADDILMLLRNLAQKHDTAVLFATHDYRVIQSFPARIIRCQNNRLLEEEDIPV